MSEVKTSKSLRKAVAKYDSKFERITARLSPDLYAKVVATGKSANAVIIEALEKYFNEQATSYDLDELLK